MKTICLNMIVKNERDVIRRSIASVRSWIDSWVIVDTGSTDGTQEIIREALRDLPGELHERPWVNFAHNRTEAIQLARGKGDYLLFIDADDFLVMSEGIQKPVLDKDYYSIVQRSEEGIFARSSGRILLANNHLCWKWVGAVHEALCCKEAATSGRLEGVYDYYTAQGDRSKTEGKFQRDVAILERMVQEEPWNGRSLFYLAESYGGAGNIAAAKECYRKRMELGGCAEEVFWSMFNLCHLSGKELKRYSEIHLFRPTRIEPLYEIASHFIQQKHYLLGYLISSYASQIPLSYDAVFVEQWMYEWGALMQCAECCLHLQRLSEMRALIAELLSKECLPAKIREQITI